MSPRLRLPKPSAFQTPGASKPLFTAWSAALAMLMSGIIKHENGYNPYSQEQINDAVNSSGTIGPPATPQISQKTEINIHGVSDPNQAAQAVAREQGSVNERLVRNLRGAVQ